MSEHLLKRWLTDWRTVLISSCPHLFSSFPHLFCRGHLRLHWCLCACSVLVLIMTNQGTEVRNQLRQMMSVVARQPPQVTRQGSHRCIHSRIPSVTGAYPHKIVCHWCTPSCTPNNSSEATNLVQPSMGGGLRCFWLISDGVQQLRHSRA